MLSERLKRQTHPHTDSPRARRAVSSRVDTPCSSKIHNLGAFLDSFGVIYPQLQQIDFRQQATRLDVPVYLVKGKYEARGRAELAAEWFANLQAPRKKLIVIDHTGHRPLFERPAEFAAFMRDTVLGDTAPDR